MFFSSLLLCVCPQSGVEVLHSYNPRSWYADCLAGPATASPDGRYLIYQFETVLTLHDTHSGKSRSLADLLGWESVSQATWSPSAETARRPGRLTVHGRSAGERSHGLVDIATGKLAPSPVLHPKLRSFEAFHASAPGRSLAVGRVDGVVGVYFVEEGQDPRMLAEGGPTTSMAISNAGRHAALLLANPSGWFDLHLFDLDQGSNRVLADGLDTSYMRTPMMFSPDDSEIVMSLVGAQHGTVEDKQSPTSTRDLDLFAIDCESGALRQLVEGPGDDLVSGVSADALTWTTFETSMRCAVVPMAGGEPRPVTGATSSYPHWHPDGDRISVMYGAFHLSDWALNWDIGQIHVDASARPVRTLEPLVVGPHEDFAGVWSPDGRWLAYHSHRGPSPALSYSGGGATDDIWMRLADGGPEIKVSTDPGFEVGQPDWSPAGFQLMFVAIDPRTNRYRPVMIDIDPVAGRAVRQHDFVVPGIDGDVIAATYSMVSPEVALEERREDGTRRIWIVDIESQEKRLITEGHRARAEGGGLDFDPWSDRLVFAALDGDHHQLFSVATDGTSEPRRLTNLSEEAYVPQVSPDGESIAFTLYTHTKTVKRTAWPRATPDARAPRRR